MKKIFSKLTTYTFFTILIFSCITLNVGAQTLDQVNQQIQDAHNQQTQIQQNLSAAQNLLSSLQNQSYSVSNNIGSLKSQITDMQSKINDVNNQITSLEKNIRDTQDELNKDQKIRESQIRQYFIDSYSQDNTLEMILSQSATLDNFQTVSAVKSYVINLQKKEIDSVSAKYIQLDTERKQVQALQVQLQQKNTELQQKQSQLQQQLNSLNTNIYTASNNTQNLKSSLNSINSNLSFLSAYQKNLLAQELAKMQAAQQVLQTPVQDGQYFFMGTGRDLIDGHGMGMSQWGAYGEALNHGWTYDQILRFYYTGVTIGNYTEPTQIVVDGKTVGPISYDDYLAGIGEVPNDWPQEAIKAQVVAARTYAMTASHLGPDGYYHICGSDSCQVFLGTGSLTCNATNLSANPDKVGPKCAEVLATKGKVILYNGSPIVAYFTASVRGYSSSLKTVWGCGTDLGSCSDLPYIQPVNDDAYAYKNYKCQNPYNTSQMIEPYNWEWRTNGYSLDELSNILSGSSRTNVGKLQNISVQKDVAGRVARITLVGSAGTKSLTGWDFRAIFNDITPYNDYVYSTDFSFYKK